MQNQKNYYIGLDIGTNSVGYAVTNTDYSLCRRNSEPMWGVTLFDAAELRTERRGYRSARRRLKRRKQRIMLLKEIFSREIAKVDPQFYNKTEESALFPEDKQTCFNPEDDKFFGGKYHKDFPTMHHLIDELMNSTEKHDIRYIYFACAWLIAHRGHFLSDINADNIEQLTDMTPIYTEFMQWFTDNDYAVPWDCDINDFAEILSEKIGVTAKEKKIYNLVSNGKKPVDNPEEFPFSKVGIIKLLCGGKIKAEKLFIADESAKDIDISLCLDKPEELESVIPVLGDNGDLLINLSRIYDCAILSKTLAGFTTISQVKISEYETHEQDLKELKYLVKKYGTHKQISDMFRNAEIGGYSAYVANYKSDIHKKDRSKKKSITRDDFYDSVKKFFKSVAYDCESDKELIEKILMRIDNGEYMPKQVTSDNRVIPHQLYYAELKKILENAAVYYDFLNEKDESGFSAAEKIKSTFLFKIPYFVGPLNKNSKFSWVERLNEKIYPWNFENVVDFEKSEQAFIDRMTNQCTYLAGEYVVPKNSLLYQKFMILNEINNLKIDDKPISVELKQNIFNDLFMPNGSNRPKVTLKQLKNYLLSNGYIQNAEARISGTDIEIKSSYRSYFDFYRLISSGKLSLEDVENIIAHSTYTEDKLRFKRWLQANYTLNDEDLKYVASKKYSDFGTLSTKLLNGLDGIHNDTQEVGTVMHFMWITNDNLMQILADEKKYTFKSEIEKLNAEYFSDKKVSLSDRLDSMYISNAVKRPIIRTLDIISDIVKVKKSAPNKIFIEMARGATEEQRNKRTVSRKTNLINLYTKIKTDNDAQKMISEINALGESADNRLQSQSLFLYFQQMGKCMYCGKPLDISCLGTEEYNIDHIWPQAYIKDDSLHNNKVLVHSKENGEKGDTYPIRNDIRQNMHSTWKYLHDAGLINDEKYKRLIRNTPFTSEEKTGFINRQLVETRQSTKAVAELLKSAYPKTEIVYVKAGLASDFRHEYGEIKDRAFNLHLSNTVKNAMQLVKCRSINDIHHANDAYLNIVAGNVYHERFTKKWFNIETDTYSLNFPVLYGYPLKRNPEIWNPAVHLPIVDKTMANMHIHLTKYQTCKKGGFFDQQPVSAGSGNLVPRKQKLDPIKYGGYNKPAASFFVLVKYKKGKKYELSLLPVELLVADKFKADKAFAAEYAAKALGKGCSDITFPLGDRILKINTVFSLDGFEVCLAGKTSGGAQVLLRSLVSCFLPKEYTAYVKRLEILSEKLKQNKNYEISETHDGVSKETNLELLKVLFEKITGKTFSKMPGAKITAGEKEIELFKLADIKEQITCLENLVLYLKTNRAGSCNMLSIGGAKSAAVMVMSATLSNWKYSDVRIIDRSASGLYETRSQNLKELL